MCSQKVVLGCFLGEKSVGWVDGFQITFWRPENKIKELVTWYCLQIFSQYSEALETLISLLA